jgi:hypothetical protein
VIFQKRNRVGGDARASINSNATRAAGARRQSMDWNQLIKNGDLVICSTTEAQAKHVYPNRFGWMKDDPSKLGALVVFQSMRGSDFAIGRNGLDYLANAKKEGRIEDGFVVLVNGSDTNLEFVNAATVEEVETILQDRPAYRGKWGSFSWVSDFKSDDSVPF